MRYQKVDSETMYRSELVPISVWVSDRMYLSVTPNQGAMLYPAAAPQIRFLRRSLFPTPLTVDSLPIA